MSDPKVCEICGDDEPHHVHDGDRRIEDYFTVGRGQTDFDAARSWKRKYLAQPSAPQALDVERLAVAIHRSTGGCDPRGHSGIACPADKDDARRIEAEYTRLSRLPSEEERET